ncbi:MAG: zinc-binding dehydrogenase [Xanthobacteraceae bacterium]
MLKDIRLQSSRVDRVACRHLFMHPSGCDLAEFSRMIEQRQLKVVVDKVHPFAAIGGAFACVEAGA